MARGYEASGGRSWSRERAVVARLRRSRRRGYAMAQSRASWVRKVDGRAPGGRQCGRVSQLKREP